MPWVMLWSLRRSAGTGGSARVCNEPELLQEPWGAPVPHTELEQPGAAAPSLEITQADVTRIARVLERPVCLQEHGSCQPRGSGQPCSFPLSRAGGSHSHVHTNTSAHTHIFQPLKENKSHEHRAYFKLIPWGIFRPKMP